MPDHTYTPGQLVERVSTGERAYVDASCPNYVSVTLKSDCWPAEDLRPVVDHAPAPCPSCGVYPSHRDDCPWHPDNKSSRKLWAGIEQGRTGSPAVDHAAELAAKERDELLLELTCITYREADFIASVNKYSDSLDEVIAERDHFAEHSKMVEAENQRLKEALGLIADTRITHEDAEDMAHIFREDARAALNGGGGGMNWKPVAITVLLAMSFVTHAYASKNTEAYYQEMLCRDVGVMEYRLPDGTRIDCLTDTHAWEVDFQNKWAEAVGQALHYARMTGKEPAVLLVGDNAERYAARIRMLADKFGLSIEVVTVKP